MGEKYVGSCLCGHVRFEVEGAFEWFYLCHCEYCRKDTGSAHAANLFAASASLKWLSGSDKITEFNLPATRHTKCFCALCGSALPYERQGAARLVVPAGSLDGQVPIRPNAHIFMGSKAGWDPGLAELPAFEAFPS